MKTLLLLAVAALPGAMPSAPARAEIVQAGHQAAPAVRADEGRDYAERQAASRGLEDFSGGAVIILSAGAIILILLFLLLL